MARTLGVNPKTLRAWLRSGRGAGHPLLASHEHWSRWEFSRADADALIAEYRSGERPSKEPAPVKGPRAPGRSALDSASASITSLPASFNRADLTRAGFDGFVTWSELREGAYALIPSLPGVYVVLREVDGPPRWQFPGTGGKFKGRSPAVTAERLAAEWVPDANTLYIGKAAARKSGGRSDGLRKRLSEYARFGAGQPIGHWGGRLIWQLADVDDLLVGWHPITWDETARDYERRLLEHFAAMHQGRRPFANLTG